MCRIRRKVGINYSDSIIEEVAWFQGSFGVGTVFIGTASKITSEEGIEYTRWPVKWNKRAFDEALAWLREHGFDVLEAPGTSGRVF
jgi:hypothetical protein